MGIQLIVMTVLAVFHGCYVVKTICQEKKEIQTDQVGKGKAGSVKLIEATMKISAFLVLGAGIISIVLDTSNGPISIRIIGVVVSAAGAVVFTTAVLTMRDSWWAGVSPTDKIKPATDGVYQFSHNSALLGLDLLHIGTLPMFFNWGLCVVSVFATLMYYLQTVYAEEVFLLATFGDEYL